MGSYAESSIEEMLATLINKVDKIDTRVSTMQASTSTMLKDSVSINKQAHPRNTTSSWKGNPRLGGGDTSQRSISPKKVDLSHSSYRTKVSSWLSSNFPPSKSLIQSERDNVNRIVKERVKYRVDFVANEDEEQCDDEKESTAIYEEDARPTFNDGVSSIVEAEDECEPLNALQILNTEPKLHEVANGNKHLREDREEEKKLESEGMLQKSIECEKRRKCETQKPRESGGGECESKKSREKNYKHVRKKSCLLDSKINLGRALNHPIFFALGEENAPYFTNSYDLSFLFDDFRRQELGGLECEPRVVDVPSNFLPVISSWKQCQDESPISQGSSILTLTCDNDLMKQVNVIGFQMPICVDTLITCGLFDMWHDNLESLLAKFSLTSYEDPFLCIPSPSKNVNSFMKAMLDMWIGRVGGFGTKRYKVFDACVSWRDRFYYCMTIKPFNGIGMFYGYFVKDLTTNGFVLRCLVNELLDFCASISCGYSLDSLEYDQGKCLDGMHICVRRKLGNHTIAYEIEFTCVVWLGCKSYASYLMQSSLFDHSLLIPSGRIFPVLLLLYDHDDGMIDEAIYSLNVLHVVMCKLDYVVLNTLGKPSPTSRTMIFDWDSFDFEGVLDWDLRTNPSKEGGDDVNPGTLKKNRRTGFEDKSFQKEGEDDVNPGSAKLIEGTKTSNEPLRNWGSVQTSICLLRRCPNSDPRPPLSSSSKYLRVGTLHAPNGVRMREI